jgi:hypothetical protein
MTKTRRTITLAAAGLLAAGGAAATTAAATSTLAQPASRAVDGDAELRGAKTLHLEAETRMDATKVWFLYGGERHAARHTDSDREDRTKDWARNVTAVTSDRAVGRIAEFKVRACDASGECTTRAFRERLERDD